MSAIFQTNFLIKTKGEMEVTVPGVGLPRWLRGKESACSSGDAVSIPGLGRSPGEGNGYPFQIQLKQLSPHTCEGSKVKGGAFPPPLNMEEFIVWMMLIKMIQKRGERWCFKRKRGCLLHKCPWIGVRRWVPVHGQAIGLAWVMKKSWFLLYKGKTINLHMSWYPQEALEK